MISAEVLNRLIPEFEPEDNTPRNPPIDQLDRNSPVRRIALWASHLRHQLSVAMQENNDFRNLCNNAGFIGTGIFRAPSTLNTQQNQYFPVVDGYQFGTVIFHAKKFLEFESKYVDNISLNGGELLSPVVQFSLNIYPHANINRGHVAALFNDEHNDICGVTAAHVVSNYHIGQKVPISCSDCGALATLEQKASGLIDAAIVKFNCGGGAHTYSPYSVNVRPPLEGETVELYLGESGTISSTVMLALQTPSQLKSAAIPKHFLTDVHGNPGDSGSLIAVSDNLHEKQELIGMYLGESVCKDGNQNFITYGYAVDLKQVVDIFGVSILTGEFNE